jgi:EmrB/QacA subfamily drug resistance transporter
VAIDGSAVATALPTLSRELKASIAWTTWTVSAYSLGSVTGMALAGRLSDALGRKRMFIFFAGAFTVTSVACGLANDIYLLVALRFLQAFWGSGLLPSAIGVISDQFGVDRDRPIGLTTTVFPLGAMLGPAIGGVIVTYFSWRLIFFVNLPIGIALVVLLWLLVPADRSRAERFGIDVIGTALFALTILTVMLGLTELGQQGVGSWIAWGLLAASPFVGTAFWLRQGYSSHPILAIELLKQRPFVVVNSLNIVYGAAAFGVFSLVPLYAQTRYGMKPLEAGALLTVRAGGMALMSTLASFFVLQRFGYRRPIAAGLGILVAGLVLLAMSPPIGLTNTAWLTIACLVSGLGVGLAGPPSNNAALQVLPARVAETTAFRSIFRQTGGIVAISAAAAWVSGSPQGTGVLPSVFAILAVLTVIISPLIFWVPENRRLINAAEHNGQSLMQ